MGTDLNYPLFEKFAYVLVLASKKIRPNFEVHKVTILTDQPLKNITQKLDATSRSLKWTIELSRYNIDLEVQWEIKA